MREADAVSGDIELDISRGQGQGQYVVRVLQAPAGTSAPSHFELNVNSLLADRVFLESVVLASSVRSRRTMSLEEKQIQKVGKTLFGALFSREIYGTYRASLAAAHQSGHQLRVVLTLSAPELAAIPWEALYDPETETYLCRTEPLVRRISAPAFHLTPLRVEMPLRVLGIVSDPADLPPLDAAAERHNLEEALAGGIAAGQIELVWVSVATWSSIHIALLDGPWHVIHFIGHGEFNGHADEGQLVLLGRDGNADAVEANRLVDLFSTARPVPRLIVLNSCSSGETGSRDLFSSTAAALVRGGIHAVTAMQFAISDEGAIAFAQGFYSALATGRSVDEAARNGRIAIRGRAGGTLEWITPVLYVRQGPTQLFTLPATASEASWTGQGPRTVATLGKEELHATYVRAQAEFRIKNYGAAVALFDDVLKRDPSYRDAAALHAEATRINQPIEVYERALTAESNGDFAEAEHLYAVALSVDPEFRDAEERRQKCNTRQRINDLQAEIRVHASSERWRAVLDVNAELQGLDPAAADPEGMATHAQMEISSAEAVTDEVAGDLDREIARTEVIVATVRSAEEETAAEPNQTAASSGVRNDARSRVALSQDLPFLGEDDTRQSLLRVLRDDLLLYIRAKTEEGEPAAPPVSEPSSNEDPPPVPKGAEARTGRAPHEDHARGAGPRGMRVELLVTRSLELPIGAMCLSPDGALMATSHRSNGRNDSTFVWDVATGRKLQTLRSGFTSFDVLTFSADSRWIGGINRNTARVFSVSSGRERAEVKTKFLSTFRAMAFSPDEQSFSTIDSEGSAIVWSIFTGRGEIKCRYQKGNRVAAAVFAADATRVVTIDSLRDESDFWDITTGYRINGSLIAKSGPPVIAVSPDGHRFATISRDGKPTIIGGPDPLCINNPAGTDVKSLAFSRDGSRLAVADNKSCFSVCDAATGDLLLRQQGIHVNFMLFSPDGTKLFVAHAAELIQWSILPV